MKDHGAERGDTEFLHPRAAVAAPSPNGDDDGERADKFGDHAVRVFKFHAADHARHLGNVAEAGRPVGDGETGVVAGDQGTGNDEDEGRERGENREIMMRPIEGRDQRTFQVRVSLFPHITSRCDAQPTMVSPWAVAASGLGRQVSTSDRNGMGRRRRLRRNGRIRGDGMDAMHALAEHRQSIRRSGETVRSG